MSLWLRILIVSSGLETHGQTLGVSPGVRVSRGSSVRRGIRAGRFPRLGPGLPGSGSQTVPQPTAGHPQAHLKPVNSALWLITAH